MSEPESVEFKFTIDDYMRQVELETERDIAKRIPRGPSADKATQIDDVFRSLAIRFVNPDTISIRTYNKMRLDDQVASDLDTITNATLSRGYDVNDGLPEHREYTKKWLEAVNALHVFEEAMLALIYGYQVFDKVIKPGSDGLFRITRYKSLPPDTIEFDVSPQGKLNAVEQNGNGRGRSALVPFVRLKPQKVSIFVHDKEYGNWYGRSALRPAYTMWAVKQWMLRYRNRFAELMGGGMFIVSAAHGRVSKARDEVDNAKSSSVIAHPKGEEIRIEYPPKDGNVFNTIIGYCNMQINKVLLVPDLLLGQNTDFGSRALSETQFASFKLTRIHKLQQDLANWIQKDIEQMIDWNFGEQDEYPRIVFKAWSVMELEEKANFYRKLAEFQIVGKNDVDWIRADLELPSMGEEGIGDPLPVLAIAQIAQAKAAEEAADRTDDGEPNTSRGQAGDEADEIPAPKRENTRVG